MNQNDHDNEAKKFFNSLSREEFKLLLEEVGFEVVDLKEGEGRIVFQTSDKT